MNRINNLSTLAGRAVLNETFIELRYGKQASNLNCLISTWKICVFEKELSKYINKDISIIHPLGFIRGTGLWMEEIVNRHYFSTINSFVYLGAAILLALVGIRNFSDYISDEVVIGGVLFEALLLVFIFVVMLFTPSDDLVTDIKTEEETGDWENIVEEIGEIGRDFAAVVVHFENMNKALNEINGSQVRMLEQVKDLSRAANLAVSPAPELINTMQATNDALMKFKESVEQLNLAAQSLRHNEIQNSVRTEVEKLLLDRMNRDEK